MLSSILIDTVKIKRLLVISILLTLVTNAGAQSCISLHKGKFKISDSKSGVTIITRDEKHQIEENQSLNIKIIFSINWIDNCTYELRPQKIIEGGSSYLREGAVITTVITKIKSHGYKAICSTNLSSVKETFIVEIIE